VVLSLILLTGTLLNITDVVCLVSQFTLYAKMKKGNKPDFHDAAAPEPARKLYDFFYAKMGEGYTPDRVKNGVFQAMMDVELKNDGPVGVNYCSEDAAVHLDFLSPFLAAIDRVLTGLILGHDRNQYQSSQEGTQGAAKWRQEDR
jgi:hypothetical protein